MTSAVAAERNHSTPQNESRLENLQRLFAQWERESIEHDNEIRLEERERCVKIVEGLFVSQRIDYDACVKAIEKIRSGQ